MYDAGSDVYAYTDDNPISDTDPLGLILKINARNAADQQALENALELVKATRTGYDLWQKLAVSPFIYTIGDWQLQNAYTFYGKINVDPNYHPLTNTNCGFEPASTALILAHEMGHGARQDWPPRTDAKEWANILEFENPIRAEWGLPPRASLETPTGARNDCGCK